MNAERLITPSDAAERLKLSPTTVRHMLTAGTLPGQKLGHVWRIREADLDGFIAAGSEAAAKARAAKAAAPPRTPVERAAARIDATPELEPYRAAILYGWNEGDAHYTWAADCPLDELLDWARAVTTDTEERTTL